MIPFSGDNRFFLVERDEKIEKSECHFFAKPTASTSGTAAVLMDLAKAWTNFVTIPAVVKRIKAGEVEFSTEDIATIAGLGIKAADVWIQQEILVPTIQGKDGRGSGSKKRLFSLEDAFIAGTVGAMRRQGFGRDTLKLVGDELRKKVAEIKRTEKKKESTK